MKMAPPLALALSLLAPLCLAAAEKPREPAPKDADPVVARVGKLEIRRSELDGIWNRVDPESRKLWEANGGKAAFLRDMATKKRLILDAQKKGIDRRTDVAVDLGVARDSILFERYIVTEVLPLLMTDERLREEYEKRKSGMIRPLRLRARHVLVTPKKDDKINNANFDDARTEEEAQKKVGFLSKRLAEGADFAQVATDYSEDETASRGGDIGWFGKGQMVKEFEEACLALKPGQLSGVVKTVYGYHLIRLEGREEEGAIPFEEISDRLRQELLGDRLEDIQKKTDEIGHGLEAEYPLEVLDPELRTR